VVEITGGQFIYLEYSGSGKRGGGGDEGWTSRESYCGEADVYTLGCSTGTGSGSGEGAGGSSEPTGTNSTESDDSDADYDNDLDDVLLDLIQGQARSQGVAYEDDETSSEEE
jgi:hypothetical protein